MSDMVTGRAGVRFSIEHPRCPTVHVTAQHLVFPDANDGLPSIHRDDVLEIVRAWIKAASEDEYVYREVLWSGTSFVVLVHASDRDYLTVDVGAWQGREVVDVGEDDDHYVFDVADAPPALRDRLTWL
jgi:hypothetical protein